MTGWGRLRSGDSMTAPVFPSRLICTVTRYYCHHPAYYLLILFPGLLVYIIVALIVRRRAVLQVALCPFHHHRRHWRIALSMASVLAGFAMVTWAIANAGGAAGVVGVITILVGLFVASNIASLRPTQIDSHVWLKGAGAGFLAQLPEMQS